MTTAVIDVGGGFRSVFGAGVLDRCADDGVTFDRAYGVSAGSANVASFISRQPGRAYRFYTRYAFRRQYASAENFFRNRNFVGLDYVYGTLTDHNGEDPMNYPAFRDNPTALTVIACNALTGQAMYFDKSRVHQDDYDILKASSAVPVACEPYTVDGVPYFDGGIADPVPVRRAAADGCERIVLILTRLKDVLRTQRKDVLPARILSRRYPQAAQRLLNRYSLYNDEVALAKRYEHESHVLIVAPTDLFGLSTLRKTYDGLGRMYRHGYAAGAAIRDYLAG